MYGFRCSRLLDRADSKPEGISKLNVIFVNKLSTLIAIFKTAKQKYVVIGTATLNVLVSNLHVQEGLFLSWISSVRFSYAHQDPCEKRCTTAKTSRVRFNRAG